MAQCQYCHKPGRTYSNIDGSRVIICRSCLQHRFETVPCQATGDGVHCEGGEMLDSATYQSTGVICSYCHGQGLLLKPKKGKDLKYVLYLRREHRFDKNSEWIKIKEFKSVDAMLAYVELSPTNRSDLWYENDVIDINGYEYKYLLEEA